MPYMPSIPPEWPTKAANALTWVLSQVATVPRVRALLERARAWGVSPLVTGDLPNDEAELLMLALYWVGEYYQHRLSPADLLAVLRHLLTIPH